MDNDMHKEERQQDEEVVIVQIEGPDGSEEFFAQDIIIPHDGKEFAVLVALPQEDEVADDFEPDIILARLDMGEDGEVEYVSPTEEEFEAVEKIYDDMFE
ncbi:MAG: DUF1292 domain-containing protein [Veillonellaceae bacterium]|nr:DUF1292 domain-containing protein [Veillonellaceae bacterium]